MKKIRVYLDTSVIGGVFDDEFSKPSKRLFDNIKNGFYIAIISELTLKELEIAPYQVRKVMEEIPNQYVEIIEITNEVKSLAKAYLEENIISEKHLDDAIHIAAATVMKVDILVSWNFKQIVNYRKIHYYNSVNLKQGYQQLEIYSPLEVIEQ